MSARWACRRRPVGWEHLYCRANARGPGGFILWSADMRTPLRNQPASPGVAFAAFAVGGATPEGPRVAGDERGKELLWSGGRDRGSARARRVVRRTEQRGGQDVRRISQPGCGPAGRRHPRRGRGRDLLRVASLPVLDGGLRGRGRTHGSHRRRQHAGLREALGSPEHLLQQDQVPEHQAAFSPRPAQGLAAHARPQPPGGRRAPTAPAGRHSDQVGLRPRRVPTGGWPRAGSGSDA